MAKQTGRYTCKDWSCFKFFQSQVYLCFTTALTTFLVFALFSTAQAQSPDDGFNPGADQEVKALAVQADGRIVVGGNFTEMGGQERHFIARLHPDGSLDADLDPGVINGTVNALAIQTDGKILVGGGSPKWAGRSATALPD